jgi:hypothetical protein
MPKEMACTSVFLQNLTSTLAQLWHISTLTLPVRTSSESPGWRQLAHRKSRLAELMLPDGAHHRAEDWTIFYLGQSRSNAITSVLQHETIESASIVDDIGSSEHDEISRQKSHPSLRGQRGTGNEAGLLYVLNCVRMKEDKSMRR